MTDRCGAVDLDDHGRGSGAVCTSSPHPGRTHIDQSDPACMIQWGPAPALSHRDDSTLCWARAAHREDGSADTGCDRPAAVNGLCARHAERFGIVAA